MVVDIAELGACCPGHAIGTMPYSQAVAQLASQYLKTWSTCGCSTCLGGSAVAAELLLHIAARIKGHFGMSGYAALQTTR